MQTYVFFCRQVNFVDFGFEIACLRSGSCFQRRQRVSDGFLKDCTGLLEVGTLTHYRELGSNSSNDPKTMIECQIRPEAESEKWGNHRF